MTTFLSRTVGDVTAEIIMSRTAFGGSLLVLEGQDDIKFWKSRIAGSTICQLIEAGCKATVIGSLVRADQRSLTGILGIVDDDCDSILGRALPSANLIHTEARDIECLMLSTKALDDVLAELGDDKKIEAIERIEGKTIRDVFISRSILFGQLRFLNSLHNWSVSFETIKPQRFAVDPWDFNISGIFKEFLRQVPSVSEPALKTHLQGIRVGSPWAILHGKDCLNVLATGLRSAIGNCQHPPERIAQMLRLAFNRLVFQNTPLYQKVRHWESINSPYKIV